MSDELEDFDDLYAGALQAALAEIARLQAVLDSRPAINAALPESYIAWSQSIYAMEAGGEDLAEKPN